MKARITHIASVSLFLLVLLAASSIGGAQSPSAFTPPQDAAGSPSLRYAPAEPISEEPPPPYSKALVQPLMDLSHLTGQTPRPDGTRIQALPPSFDWRNKDGNNYVTPVRDQGGCGSCSAFGALGNIESKLLINGAGTYDLSENHAKSCSWYGLTCSSGGNYLHTANLYSKTGTVLESQDPYTGTDVPCGTTVSTTYQHTLQDWRLISGSTVPTTTVLKQYIYDYGPVYAGLYAGRNGDSWEIEMGNYDGLYTLYYSDTITANHAVLLVGWDDSLVHAGGTGAWIAKNSWGTSWGNNGYFTIAYGSASIGTDASMMVDWQPYDQYGGLLYYDEGGWASSLTFGGTTNWGLAVFTPTVNSYATRVEFWTTAISTTADVHVYGDFDGTSVSGLRDSVPSNTYYEAGYHSVPLSEPLALTSGDDIVAVVKFTNNEGYSRTLPLDSLGPSSGNTYASPNGTDWYSMTNDVAIRLRTTAAPVPDVSINKRVLGGDFDPGDHITYTLTIANSGSEVANRTVVTDDVPAQVVATNYASTLVVTQTGVLSYVWDIEPLAVGESGVITISGQISSGLASVAIFTNTAIISDTNDRTPSNNTGSVSVGGSKVYLPIVAKNYPPPPTTGLWRGTSTAMEFYVTSTASSVDDFAIYVDVDGCGLTNYKITHASPESVTNHRFSFSGSFSASGTFSSTTTAGGVYALNGYEIPYCGPVGDGTQRAWSATWRDGSQPESRPAEGVEP